MKLAKETDESASDVVVYGMVRRLSPATGSGEQCSPPSLQADGEGSLHGMVDALVTHEQGIDSRYDAAMMMLAGETDESASDVVVYGMVSRFPPSLGQPTAECVKCVVPAAGVDEPVSNVVVYGMMPSVPDVNFGEAREEIEESCVNAVDYGMVPPLAATSFGEAREGD